MNDDILPEDKSVWIDYENWKGERRVRRVIPDGTMIFDDNEWHPKKQWLMGALDPKDGKYKLFALANIWSFKPVKKDLIISSLSIDTEAELEAYAKDGHSGLINYLRECLTEAENRQK